VGINISQAVLSLAEGQKSRHIKYKHTIVAYGAAWWVSFHKLPIMDVEKSVTPFAMACTDEQSCGLVWITGDVKVIVA